MLAVELFIPVCLRRILFWISRFPQEFNRDIVAVILAFHPMTNFLGLFSGFPLKVTFVSEGKFSMLRSKRYSRYHYHKVPTFPILSYLRLDQRHQGL